MTLHDWIRDSQTRFQTHPLHIAARKSVQELAHGGKVKVDSVAHRSIPSVWDRGEWDVLVILDACRVDLLESVNPEYDNLGGSEIESVWSKGSTSIDWINRTFNDYPDEIENTAYVTANPFADHDADNAKSADLSSNPNLGHFRPLYKSEWREIGGIETVPPEYVTNHAIECWRNRDEYDIDRLVVHYMQPHEPYITKPSWSYQSPQDNPVLKNLVTDGYQAGSSPWQAMVNTGRVSPEEFWPVYQDNLRWVLNDVTKRLLENLDADSVVVSADHGNGLGEWGTWHHPPGSFAPAVRKVPWVETTGVDTKSITPSVTTRERERGIDSQLEALGYR